MSDIYSKKYIEWMESEWERKEYNSMNDIPFVPSEPPTICFTEIDMKIIYEEEYRNRKTIIKNEIKNDTIAKRYPHMKKTTQNYMEAEKIRQKNLKEKRGFLFITISPEDGKFTQEFIEDVKSIFSWSWINEMWFVFEQRGDCESNMGRGAHAHILISDWDNEKSKAEKQITEKFRKYVGAKLYGKKLKEVLNVLDKKMEWMPDKMEYILGTKTDEGKPEKQAMDKLWRKKNSYENYYHYDNSTDKKELSIKGGRRKGSGVKLGTKRGPYKKKSGTKMSEEIKLDKMKIENKSVKISF